jgi:trigger factor
MAAMPAVTTRREIAPAMDQEPEQAAGTVATSMNATVEPLEGNKVRLRVAVPADEFEKAIDAAFRKISREVRIPGFRPGKAPRRLLEARVGSEVAREQALRDALPEYYADAVIESDLDPIAPPEIDITAGKESGDVEFDAVVEIRPIITLEGYQELPVTLDGVEVSEDEVDAQIDRLRDRFADLEDSVRPLQSGDFAQIDITGYIHDEVIEGLSATDFLYEVGSAGVVPKLDEELLGKRAGDILKFNDVLTERFGDRQGEEVAFSVLVKGTKTKVLPELNDEWASEASEFDTLFELRGDVRNRLELVRKVQAHVALREKVLESVADLVAVDAPEPLVRDEMERRVHDLVHRLEEQGVTIAQYLAANGIEQEQFLAGVRAGSTAAVKADLALRAVIAQENLTATDDEVDAEVARLSERAKMKPEKLRRELDRSGQIEAVRSDVARGKAIQFLVDHARVIDGNGNLLDLSIPEPPTNTATETQEDAEA